MGFFFFFFFDGRSDGESAWLVFFFMCVGFSDCGPGELMAMAMAMVMVGGEVRLR